MHSINIPLNDAELEELDNFLLYRGRNELDDYDGEDVIEGIIDISELDGFFTAIVSGPEVIFPSRWLPAIWGDVAPVWPSDEVAQRILTLLMRHMNGIVSSLMNPDFHFEPIYLEREVNGETVTLVDSWCIGYMKGFSLSQDAWDNGDDEILDYLETILLFTHGDSLEVNTAFPDEDIAELRESIPAMARAIHTYWLGQRDDFAGMETVVLEEPKIGRNEPCPCGSGKKYKKCCLH